MSLQSAPHQIGDDPRAFFTEDDRLPHWWKMYDEMMLELIPRVEELCAEIPVWYSISHSVLVLSPHNEHHRGAPWLSIAARPGEGYFVRHQEGAGARRGAIVKTTTPTLDDACALIGAVMGSWGGDWSPGDESLG